MEMNLQKFISHTGYCSRRKAGILITAGKVKVNGEKAQLGMKVSEFDKIEVDGKILKLLEKKIYIKLFKPVGYVCTNRRFRGEKNLFDLEGLSNMSSLGLFAAGRLDKNSRGLVLITNDGKFAEEVIHPRFGHEKEYEIRIKSQELKNGKKIPVGKNSRPEKIINQLKEGVDIGEGDGFFKAKRAEYLGHNRFFLTICAGKKRQIRRMFSALGYDVEDLLRIGIGPLKIGNLKEGKWEYLKNNEITSLKFRSTNYPNNRKFL